MGTQSGAILDLPPTERAKEAARAAFDGVREIGVGTDDLEETALMMSARMIDSARHAAIDAVHEALEGQTPSTAGSIKVFVLGVVFGAGVVTFAVLVALLTLHFGLAR